MRSPASSSGTTASSSTTSTPCSSPSGGFFYGGAPGRAPPFGGGSPLRTLMAGTPGWDRLSSLSGCCRSAVAAGADDVQVQGVHRGDIGFPFPRDLLEDLGERKAGGRIALLAVKMGGA